MRTVARRPDENHHCVVKKPDGDEALLTIVSPVNVAPASTSPARAMSSPLAAKVAVRLAASNAIGTIYVTT